MTTITIPAPEPKATIIGFRPDGSPIWANRMMHLIRDRKGAWIEIPAAEIADAAERRAS